MTRRPELLREAGVNFAALIRSAPQMGDFPVLVEEAAKAVQGLMDETADGLEVTERHLEQEHQQYLSLLGHFISYVDLQRAMIEALLETGDTSRARASLPLLHNLSFRLQMGRTGLDALDLDEEDDL